jgi:NhaP-type Na+/H+ or K+/H+ antiporter
MTVNVVLAVGVIVVVGFVAGAAAAKVKLPRITGYIAAGLLLNPSVLPLMPDSMLEATDIVSTIALSVIAYTIGGSIRLTPLRKQARSIIWITPLQGLFPWLLTTIIIMFLTPFILKIPNATFYNTYFPMAIVLGAIAIPIAPDMIVAIVREYEARGPLTTTLLSVVALTDALAIIAFYFAVGIAEPMAHGSNSFTFYKTIVSPLLHIVESVGIGIVFGFTLAYTSKFIRTRTLLLVLILGTIILCAGVTELRNASHLVANMVVAFIAVNTTKRKAMISAVDEVIDIILIVFFVLCGMHFHLHALKSAGVLTLLIIVGRWVGKYSGATAGAKFSGAPDMVRKYLGLALLPKAGLAIGLAFIAESTFTTFGRVLFDGVLASVIINTLTTPFLVRYALFKAGEQGIRISSHSQRNRKPAGIDGGHPNL